MKKNIHDIVLVVKDQLERSKVREWVDIVDEEGPVGIVAGMQIHTGDELTSIEVTSDYDYQADEWSYRIPLTRNLTQSEGDTIADAWADYFEGDFEITSSSNAVSPIDFDQFDVVDVDNTYEMHYSSTTKEAEHNRWVLEQIEQGWRLGPTYNKEAKITPLLKPYHELSNNLKSKLDYK